MRTRKEIEASLEFYEIIIDDLKHERNLVYEKEDSYIKGEEILAISTNLKKYELIVYVLKWVLSNE